MNNKKIIFGVVILLLVIVAVFFSIKFSKQRVIQHDNQDKANAIKQKFPQYFVNKDSQADLVTAGSVDASKLTINKNEQLEDGISYVENLDIEKTQKKIFDGMIQNGWMSIRGSYTVGNIRYMKLQKGNELIYVKLEPLSDNNTRITMLPVKEIK